MRSVPGFLKCLERNELSSVPQSFHIVTVEGVAVEYVGDNVGIQNDRPYDFPHSLPRTSEMMRRYSSTSKGSWP